MQHPTVADMRLLKVRLELERNGMCDHGACSEGVGQLLGPSNPRVELVVDS